jgi:hypothetical protein
MAYVIRRPGNAADKLAVLRGTRAQKSKMASFHSKTKDEGELDNGGAIDHENEINNPVVQKKGAVGRVSKGGGVGKAESQMHRHAINDPVNKKVWPKGGDVKASNPKTGNTKMKGPIARSGGLYGGGGRGTQ